MLDAYVLSLSQPGTMLTESQALDQELKIACEAVIASCASPVTRSLRDWTDRVVAHRVLTSKPLGTSSAGAPAGTLQPLTSLAWAAPTAVTALFTAFNGTCATELRAAVGRLRLYLEDERTVGVLLGHVQDRIVDDWAEWRTQVRDVYPTGSGAEVEVGTEDLVRAMVRGACDEHSGPSAGPSST